MRRVMSLWLSYDDYWENMFVRLGFRDYSRAILFLSYVNLSWTALRLSNSFLFLVM